MRHTAPLPGMLFRQGLTLALCLALCLTLCACGARQTPVDPQQAGAFWQAMQVRSSAEISPYRDTLSLRFGKEGDTRRVTALIWGNGKDVMRLDVRAGVGATIAMLRQEGQHFLLYAPMEEKAWFHEGANSPLLKLGLPLPVDLLRLEALLHSRWTAVFGSSWSGCSGTKSGVAFDLDEGMGGTLIVAADGLPVRWSDKSWTMDFTFAEDGSLKRLDLANIKGEKGIVLIRQREHPAPFDDAQMQLKLPEGTSLQPLRELSRN